MERLHWNPRLETGNETIDEQHKRLFQMARELEVACMQEHLSCSDQVTDAVYALSEYCVQHFSDEEEVMRKTGYPQLERHRLVHERLTAEMMRLIARHKGTEGMQEVAPYLADLLTRDVEEADRLFAEYLSEHAEAQRVAKDGD